MDPKDRADRPPCALRAPNKRHRVKSHESPPTAWPGCRCCCWRSSSGDAEPIPLALEMNELQPAFNLINGTKLTVTVFNSHEFNHFAIFCSAGNLVFPHQQFMQSGITEHGQPKSSQPYSYAPPHTQPILQNAQWPQLLRRLR